MSADRATSIPFAVISEFFEDEVVVSVRGEINIFTAPDLGVALNAVIEATARSVVVDLEGIEFLDASGSRVILTSAHRIGRQGGTLVVRSASQEVLGSLLGSSNEQEFVVDATRPDANVDAAGRPDDSRSSSTQAALRVALPPNTLKTAGRNGGAREISAAPSDPDLVDGALRLVVALTSATIRGADGVSVSLLRHGRLGTVAASDQTVSDMDSYQYESGEGPCVDASTVGNASLSDALTHEERWPTFVPRARSLGIQSILSTPLLLMDEPVGAINIYSKTPNTFRAEDQDLASVFAAEASVVLASAGHGVTEDEFAERIGASLRVREVIAQAQGIVMARETISPEHAYELLRSGGAGSHQTLLEFAKQIVHSLPADGDANSLDVSRGNHR